MYFHFPSWLRGMMFRLSGEGLGSSGATVRHSDKKRRRGLRLQVESLERRDTPVLTSFSPGAYLIDMGQPTQTVGNALKPYGLVYDMVTNFKVPVNWAINRAKTTFHLDAGDAIPVDFTATITTGTKNYSGGSFIIDSAFLTPAVIADINTWKAQGVVVDTLAAPLTTEIYGQVTSFPHAVLDAQNGKIAVPYYVNAGVPASSYQIGNPTDLDHCDDVYILTHADPIDWPVEWKLALFNFIVGGGGMFAECHGISEIEDLFVNGTTQLSFLTNNGAVPFGDHSNGTPPYSYNSAAANDPVMQIMDRLDAATQNGSEQIYVPNTGNWRSTTTVAVFDPDHPDNPVGGTSPFNTAAVIAYGPAFGNPSAGLVMYEGGHSLAKGTGPANVAAQRTFFNFLLLEGIVSAPQPVITAPTITAGVPATLTATITGGSGTYNYKWVSSNGGVFSVPAGTWTVGDPPITTQYLLTNATDTVRLVVTDIPCNRQGIASINLADPPPVIDLDGDNSSGATGADYRGFFTAGATVAAADADTLITDNGAVIKSAAIKLTTRPDGTAETLLINTALATSFGINVASDGNGGFILTGTATLAQYQQVIASLQYTDSFAFPNTQQRVITVTVNDGISNSNTATSRLDFLGGSVTTVNKQLYLSDPGQGMDRIDPVATNDTTTSSVAVTPVVSTNSTGLATWTNDARKNLEYRPWNLTNYGPQNTTVTNGGSYITMASAASPKRNESIVVGVTSDGHISGSIWNGSSWTPIAINIGGTVTQNLGHPSQDQWWGAAVAYETNSGRALLVWNTGGGFNGSQPKNTLEYSIWNGTSWTAAATIPAYSAAGGVEPRQMRLAANPLPGSNEMVLVVSDKNKVDRALVWNGSSWGNVQLLDNNGGHNFTDVNVAYEQQTGRAMVVFASGTTGNVGFQIWNGASWTAGTPITPPAGTDKYAQWTVVAGDPNSNRIVLGVESNGKDAWMNVWNGTAWGTSTLGVQDGVDNNNNLEIAVAFESTSGDALAVYQNNENTNTTELQYRTFSGGVWSAGTNLGNFANKVSRSITLSSNPYSDQVQLMVNDDAKDLRSFLWTGSSFNAPIQLETNTNTQNGQPMSFIWDRFAPGTVTTTVTFTQTAPMAAPFVMPAGGAVTVTTYIQVTSGALPAAPRLAVTLAQASGQFAIILPPPAVTNLGGGFFKLVWTGTMPNNVVVPTGGQISLTYTDFDTSYSFNILYDSNTDPSQVQVATATGIAVTSLGIFPTAFPGGSPITSTPAGQPAFVRFTVTDPFGASDITSADVVIKNSSGGTVLSTTLTDPNVVTSTASSKTYELAWIPPVGDTFTVTVTAHEGTEGVTATSQTTVTATAQPDLVVSKSDGGATVNAGGSVAYTINYSNAGLANATGVVLTEFLPTGSSFNAAGSTPGWVAVGSGQFRFPVGSLAAGASGSAVFSVTVPTPVPAGLELINNTVLIADDGTHGPDTNPANNSGVDSTPVNAAPDLVVTKTDGGTSTLAGGIVLYQINYTNIGTQNADGVVITETLPANTTFNSTFSSGAWDDEGTGVFTLIVGDLPVGASGTVTFAVNVASPLPAGVTQIANTVSIADSGDGGPDLNPANNTATDTTPIANNPQADLQITKTNGVTSVQPGSIVTYTITVTNAGPNAVTGAAFTDNVPATLLGVSYTTAVFGGAALTPTSGTGNSISGSLNVPVGGTVIYTVTGTLDSNATGTLTNAATVLPPAGILDPNTGNNTAVDSDPIVSVSDLSLNKTFTFTDLDGSGTLTPGDRIVFALTVTNSGPNPAHNVTVQDLLPNGYQYVSDDAAVNGGTYAIGTGIWTIGSAIGATAPNNTAVLHITAIVGPGGTYTNQAEINSSDSFDPDSTPDNDVPTEDDFTSVTPIVQPKSDLSLAKTMALTSDLDGNGIQSIGDRVTFTLTLNNAGPNDAANVHVKDLLPAGYAFFSAAASQGTYTSATGDWNLGTVSVLSSPTLSIVATVVGGKPASAYTNYAEVSASGSFDPDSTPNNNSTTEDDDASVAPFMADLSVTKTAALANDADGSGTLTVGDDVVFTVTVSNAGPDFATGVKLVDLLTAGYTYVSDDSPGTYDPTTGLWTVGTMAPGTTQTLNITATVNPAGPYSNTAQVTASQQFDPDSTPNNNVASEDDQAAITLTPGATAQPPVAVNDSSLHNPAGPVTLNVTNNDTDPNLNLDPSTVDLNPSVAGQQTTLVVPGQGTWSVDSSANVTFTPQSGFTKDPTPITYKVSDTTGLVSNAATITIDYVPVATNDSSTGNTTGTAVTVPVLTNDTTGDTAVPSTVQIVGTLTPGAPLVAPGQGTWTVNTTTGAITFTPAPGFTGDPTPIQYTVQDAQGNTSNAATVTIDYNQLPPVAVNDSSLNNPLGPVTLNVTANDTDPNNDLDPSTVDLDPATPGQQTIFIAPGQGFWQTDNTGNVTFFPDVGFTQNPTPINYTVSDKTVLQSNVASITITFRPLADLQVTKTVSNATPNVGDTITFTITLKDNGPGADTGVQVSDQLPAGLAFVSATPGQGSYDSGTGIWTVGALASGAQTTLTITATVVSPDAQTNTATISHADVFDPNTANNSASATVTPREADLALAKTVSNPNPNVGDTISFTVTLTNLGPDVANSVSVQDLLPAGLAFVSATPSQGSYQPTDGKWNVGSVDLSTPQTLILTAQVVSFSPQTNTATISHSNEFDPNTDNNTASATETPQKADLVVTKVVNNAAPNVGDTITFTVTVTNAGPNAATGVQLTDLLPAGLSLVTASPSQGTYTPGSGIWDVGTISNTGSATLQLQALVVSPAAQTNTASVSHSDQFDPNTGNNSANATETPQQADLQVSKRVSDPTPNVGETITYTITLTDNGPNTATNVTVQDTLPAGVSFVSATPPGSYNPATGVWTVGTVTVGAPQTLIITATVISPNPQANAASVSHADQFDPNLANNSDSASIIPQQADLAIGKTVSNARPNVGDTITFTVTLTDNGPNSATNVNVTDLLPAGLTLVSAAPSQGSYNSATGLWTVGTLANGAQVTLTLQATVVSPAAQTNTATISAADQFDPVSGNNTDSATETPQQADLAVTKIVSNSTPNVGDTITFTITLNNAGPDSATNVVLNDLLPSGLSFISAAPSQGNYNNSTGVWNVGTVATSGAINLILTARVDSPNPLTNTAAIGHSDQFDPNTANNQSSATETPQRADLQIAKTVSNPNPNVGDTISFTVTLNNLGPDVATNVQVADLLPAGLTFVSAIPSQGSYNNTTGVWTIGTVGTSLARTLVLNARVNTSSPQTNTATVSRADQFDPNPGNNTASATESPQQADLKVQKSVNNPHPNVGDTITYTVSLSNAGPDAASNVQVTDLIPAGLSFVGATPSQGTYDSGSGVWTVGNLANGAVANLLIQARVDSPDAQFNQATVTQADQFDPNPGNNSAGALETPQQADLAVGKSVSDPTPNVGDTITYTVHVTNNGPDAATNVAIQDVLPAGVSYQSSSATQGMFDPATTTWTVGTVAVGATQTLTITATVVTPDPQTNTTTISQVDQFDPNPANNTNTASINPQHADLQLGKIVSNPKPNVGDTITFTVTLTDNGPDTATNVEVSDLLPAGLAFVAATPSQGTYVPGTGVWTVGTVTMATPATLSIQARVTSPAAQTNTATISHADQFDPDPGNNSASAVETPQQADLAVTKSVSNATPNVGDTITFTVTLVDNGPDTATAVTLQDLLPAGLTLQSFNPSQGTYTPATGVWNVGTVDPSAARTLTLSARVDSPTPLTNTASISHSDQFDPVTTNNSASATETPQQADVAITKSVSNSTPNVGDVIIFTIVATNNGPNPATNVQVNDLLPAGLTLVSATPSQGTYSGTTGLWTVGQIDIIAPATLTLRAQVVSPNAVTNTATISHSDQFDPNTANNTASAAETPQQADLQVTKTVSDDTPNVGDTITFTVTLTNNGPDPATNVVILDRLPSGLGLVSAVPSQGSYDSIRGIWTVGTVSPGAPQTLTFTATVISPNSQTNVAAISQSDQFDPDTTNNSASAAETPQQADLQVTKAVSDPTPNVGDTITFTVTLTNGGADTATNVTVQDLLPAGLTFVSATPSQGTYDNTSGAWSVGTVTTTTAQTLTIQATVASPNSQTNTASVNHSDQFDPNTANNSASATEVPQQADLQVGKSVSNPTPNVGDTITYTITVTNNGPDAATGVTVQDSLPGEVSFVSAAPAGSYDPVSGVWTVGSVSPGFPQTLVITATVQSPNPSANTASISHADQFDPNTANNGATASVDPQQADLAVSKTVSNSKPNVGDTITFTVTLTDNGPSDATGVQLTDLLPGGLALVIANPSQGSYDPGTGVWTVGAVANGAQATLTLQATVISPLPRTNTATITAADQFDPVSGNNSGSATETPQLADLALAKTVSDAAPNVGDTVTFTVTLTDRGPDAASNVTVQDLLPPGLTFVSATASQGTYNSTTGAWVVGAVTTATPLTLQILAKVVSPSPRTNTASVSHSDQFDPVGANNTASATETPQQADLQVAKTVSDSTPNVGDVITFTVSVTNSGPDAATGVTISDPIPAGLSFVSATTSAGSYNSITGVWTVGTLSSGAGAVLTLGARVVSPAAQTNTASISHSDQFDPQTGNNTASVTETPRQADLQVAKAVSNPTPNVGDTITFTVNLTNAGPDSATNVALTDLLPAGLAFVTATPSQGTYASATGIWTVGTVAPATPQTLQIQARVISPAAQTNTATVTGADQFDPNTGNNTASAVETPQQADLTVAKTVSNAAPNVGDTITFTVTLTNQGPGAATNVTIADLLPAGLSFVSATASVGSYNSAAGVWTVGTVAAGAPQTLAIQATVVSAAAQTNTAAVGHSDQFDPNTSNNSASVTETPQQADLALTKTVSNSTPNVGDTITFTVTLTNTGPDAATNVAVADLLPAGLTFVSATPSQGNYNNTSGVWQVGTVTTTASQTLQILATVASPGPRTNTAQISHADQFDPNAGNNSAAVTETPQQADLAIGKTVSNPTPNVGDTITYTITLTDNGPDPATGVTVQDLVPAGISFVSATPSVGNYNPSNGVWTVGTVNPGAPQTLTILGRVTSANPQANTATISHADQFDPNPGNNTSTASTDPQQADLQLGKVVSNPRPNVGDTVIFTVTLTDNGPSSATNVSVTDLLPAGLTLVNASPSQGSYVPATGIWTVGTLANGAQATLTLQAQVVSPAARTNTATISHSDQFDPNAGNNTASATETPQQADLQISKTVSNATPNVGDTITFTIALTDKGPDAATNVQVTDLLPAGLSLVSATPSRGTYVPATGVWTVGDVDPSAAQTLILVAQVVSPTAQTNTAAISHSDQFDPITTNNTASATETPQQADLALTKTVSNSTPNVGDNITFTVTLSNQGPNAATNVAVADLLPAGVSFVSATPSLGSYNSGTGLWSVGTVAGGANATLAITATVVSSTAQTNTASISHSDQFDPNPGNNSASTTETPQQADLQVAKTVSDSTPNVGDTITFTITLTNAGPDSATGVRVIDALPAGLNLLAAAPSQGVYNPITGVWTVGTVAPGAPQTLTLQAKVVSSTAQTNTATINHSDQFDPNAGNNQASVTESPQQADLQVTKTVSNATPNVGDTITFTITLTNAGPDAATNVSVADLLPAGLAFVSATPSQGTYTSASGVWVVGTVTTGTPQTLQIQATVVSPAAKTNTATISGADQFDPNPGNNSAAATEIPQQADLQVTKSVSNPTPNVGDTITFTVTLANAGPDPATGVAVQDTLPPGVAFVAATPSQGNFDSGTGLWTVGTVIPGAPQTLTLTVTVIDPATSANTASVSHADQFDPNTANNTDVTTIVPQQANLAILKSVDRSRPNVGDTVTFTITLSNSGPSDATNVTVSDLLPAGLQFVSATASQGTYDDIGGLWTAGTVTAGAPQTLQIQAKVISADAQTNTAAVSHADQFDPNPGNNTGSATETPQQADLKLTKTVSNATPNVGDSITFTITLADLGPDAATSVQVSDLLPAGLTLLLATPSQGTYVGGVWDAGTIDPSAAQTLTLLARVDSPDAQTNTASVSHSDQFDPQPGNNTASATETPQQSDLALAKAVSNATPNVGDTITFTVTLSNQGPNAATNVTVADLLPAGLGFVTATPSLGSYDSGSGQWSVGTIAGGTNATLTISATVNSSTAQTNTATINHSDQFDPNSGNNSASVTETPQQADLAVTKSVSNANPNVGDTITFTVTVTNAGPDTAANVELTDLLPAGLAFLSATPSQGSYTSTTGIWAVGAVAPGTPQTLQIQARVTSSTAQTNTATISHADQFDPDTSNNTGSATESPQQANLNLKKTVSNATPNVGDTIAYTLTLTNNGPDAANNVTVTDLLPAGVTLLNTNASQGAYDGSSGLWTVGTLANTAIATLTLTVRVDTPASKNNIAVAGANEFDPDPADNTSNVVITPPQADVAISKTVSNTRPNVGDVVTFTLQTTNHGPDDATGIIVHDLLPAGLTFVSATPSQGTYDSGTGDWSVGNLANGASATLTIRATVVSPTPATNFASVAADQFDPDHGNNNASATETPQQADLHVTKTVNVQKAMIGQVVHFTIVVSNAGVDAATNVRVMDSFPAGLQFVGITSISQGSYNPTTHQWNVGTLAVGATATLIIAARVNTVATILNQVTAVGDQFDPAVANNHAAVAFFGQFNPGSISKRMFLASTTAADMRIVRVTRPAAPRLPLVRSVPPRRPQRKPIVHSQRPAPHG